MERVYDIIVVGGGHAGCEAAMAAATLGSSVLLVTMDKEAVRVIQSSPKWTPGKQRDRAVKVTYQFPVIFQLR